VPIGTRFAMNSVGLSRVFATMGVGIAPLNHGIAGEDLEAGRLVRVLPAWQLKPIQVHAITESRLLPARTRLFIDFLKERLRASVLAAEGAEGTESAY